MKRVLLISAIFLFLVIPLKSIHMSIGIHVDFGKTFADKYKVAPPETVYVDEWDSSFGGYFIQVLFNLKKIDVGLEYGKCHIFSLAGRRVSSYYGFHYGLEKIFTPYKLLAIIQYEIIDSLFLQAGSGFYLDNPEFGFMVSIRNHLKVTKFLEIPVFLRADLIASNGLPDYLSISAGAGLIIKWKSGL